MNFLHFFLCKPALSLIPCPYVDMRQSPNSYWFKPCPNWNHSLSLPLPLPFLCPNHPILDLLFSLQRCSFDGPVLPGHRSIKVIPATSTVQREEPDQQCLMSHPLLPWAGSIMTVGEALYTSESLPCCSGLGCVCSFLVTVRPGPPSTSLPQSWWSPWRWLAGAECGSRLALL